MLCIPLLFLSSLPLPLFLLFLATLLFLLFYLYSPRRHAGNIKSDLHCEFGGLNHASIQSSLPLPLPSPSLLLHFSLFPSLSPLALPLSPHGHTSTPRAVVLYICSITLSLCSVCSSFLYFFHFRFHFLLFFFFFLYIYLYIYIFDTKRYDQIVREEGFPALYSGWQVVVLQFILDYWIQKWDTQAQRRKGILIFFTFSFSFFSF